MAVVENGFSESPDKFINSIDPDDPEYRRQLMRPAEIKEDLNLMSERRRVSVVLKSETFRKELEEIIENYLRSQESTGLNSSLLSLQHIADLFSTIPGKRPLTGGGFTKSYQNGVIPINDLRGSDTSLYSRRERMYRCKLACVYRLIELFGWNTSIYNHATVRISRNEEHFLINPFGLLYHEVTASSLIKIDSQGIVLDPGSTVLEVDQAGWLFHSTLHSTRPDIRCIIHLGTPATIAVSCMKTGLLPLSQEAIILGEVAYFTPQRSLPADPSEGGVSGGSVGGPAHPSLVAADLYAERNVLNGVIGQDTHILFVRYHGLFALGDTVEEAWHYATNAVVACETQIRLASLGVDHLVLPDQRVQKRAYEAWRTTDLGGVSGPEATMAIRLAHARTLSLSRHNGSTAADAGYLSDSSLAAHTSAPARPWRLGELEFEALMRHLDNAGYRTGHLYRQDAVISPRPSRRTLDRSGAIAVSRRFEDVEIPPFTSSAATTMAQYYDDVGAFSGDESDAPRPGTLRRQWSDQKWLNTPNNYTKEVSTLPGRQEPVSHWVSSREATLQREISSGRLPPPTPFHPLTPAAIPLGTTGAQSNTPSSGLNFNRFVPQGDNPKEFKEHQKKVREKYFKDTNTAGPQSRLLEGLTWDEARRIRDEALSKALGPGVVSTSLPDTHSTVAAASKAILHRDVRDAAVVYDGIYTKQNPFGQVTDEELEAYKREIEIKNNPALYAEWLRQHEIEQAAATTGKVAIDSKGFAQSLSAPLVAGSSIVSDSELHETTYVAGSHLSPPPVGTITSETSELEDSQTIEKKQKKKKRRFKLPSFARKSRTKEKKGGQETSHTDPGEAIPGGDEQSTSHLN